MRCCVPYCRNDTRHASKSQGITFHTFPTTPSLRTAWLKAISKPDWQPKERSAICSLHFSSEDLYVTQSGLRRVRAGAVPISQGAQNSYEYDSTHLQACRMCLTTDHTMFPMKYYNLEAPFERFTNISLKDDELPQHLCSECAQRLQNADRFRSRSIQANSLLLDLVKNKNLTKQSLKSIDRDSLNLTTLSIKHNLPDKYDLEIEFVEPKQEPIEAIEPIEEKEQNIEDNILPLESEIFADDIKDFDFSDGEDKTYTTKTEDFDSEDSVPLELTRKKKKKEKAKTKKVRKKPVETKIDRRRKPFLNQDLNETLFTITNLTIEQQIDEIQKRQYTDNYKHALYKCEECYKGFLDQSAYNSHMSRHTDECGEYRCEICKTHFKQSHALRKHITAHHTQRFSCKQCPYVTTHRQTARLHERWHKGTKYRCPHCQDEFVKFTTYMGHVRIKHPSDFVCELCGYSFVSAKGIELHKKLKHRNETGPVPSDGPYCNECGVRFASMEAHRKHLAVSAKHSSKENREANKANKGQRTREIREKLSKQESEQDDPRKVYPSQLRKAEGPIPCEQSYALLKDHTWTHTGERPFKCDQCDKSFRMKQRLVAHRRVHSLVKASYVCSCGVQLEDSRAYHGHFRRMHPDKNRTNYPSMKSPCMCELCGRIFQSYALLKDHTWTHTGERPFKCDQCDKSFRMKQRLVAHRRVHSLVKASYVCSVCGKHFSTHSNRQRHMFIHTGLKPFKCEMCGKGFKHASEKRAHVTYVHLKKPWPKRTRGKRLRQDSLPPQGDSVANEMDIQPVWPSCVCVAPN